MVLIPQTRSKSWPFFGRGPASMPIYILERLFVEERRRLKIIPNAFGEKPVLKLMFGAMIRAAERWRAVKVTEFERRQLAAVETRCEASTGLDAAGALLILARRPSHRRHEERMSSPTQASTSDRASPAGACCAARPAPSPPARSAPSPRRP